MRPAPRMGSSSLFNAHCNNDWSTLLPLSRATLGKHRSVASLETQGSRTGAQLPPQAAAAAARGRSLRARRGSAAARADPAPAWRPRGRPRRRPPPRFFRHGFARPARRARSIFCCGTPGTATAPPWSARRRLFPSRTGGARGPLRPSGACRALGSRVAERAPRRGGAPRRRFSRAPSRRAAPPERRARRRASRRPVAPLDGVQPNVIRRPPLPMESRPWAGHTRDGRRNRRSRALRRRRTARPRDRAWSRAAAPDARRRRPRHRSRRTRLWPPARGSRRRARARTTTAGCAPRRPSRGFQGRCLDRAEEDASSSTVVQPRRGWRPRLGGRVPVALAVIILS